MRSLGKEGRRKRERAMADGGGTGFDVQFLKDVMGVIADGTRAKLKDGGDLAVAFAFADPVHDFAFARG